MPTISMFFGIIVRMYFAPGKHNRPHFHAYYNEYKATVDIRTCEVLTGELPKRQTRLIQTWAELFQEELRANWKLVTNGEDPFKLQPLQQEEIMYPSVREVTANEDFQLNMVPDNGENRLLDMKPYLDLGVFKKLRDCDRFKRARVSFDTIEWDDGVDLDPEFVYDKSKPIEDV